MERASWAIELRLGLLVLFLLAERKRRGEPMPLKGVCLSLSI
jgi:hypothetical protein